ncbi:TetR/AcrR family transcriptional regulator [Nonomuraea sp. NBC_01738]|uniref:TetR/AcrR family transcriptional regulator n=1 Tax=Nonomuraea sp. NBC_01738 TaxID=2976003 RepID=UPI002E1373B9|nr:TetR/AcrR family transcriptional regulator [Nonomuraea sp. NBC_01738]
MAANREEIVTAAIHHLNEVPTASMTELAEAVGVSRATLHRHFTSRDELLIALGRRALEGWALVHDRIGLTPLVTPPDASRPSPYGDARTGTETRPPTDGSTGPDTEVSASTGSDDERIVLAERHRPGRLGVDECTAAQLRVLLHDLLASLVEVADEHGFALTDHAMAVDPDLLRRAEELEEREIALFVAAQRAGVLRGDVPPRWISNMVYGLIVAVRESLRRGDVARRDLPRLLIETFHGGIA